MAMGASPLGQWKQTSSNPDTFERPFGITERGFYWDSLFNRTADIIRVGEVEVQGTSIERLLSPTTLAEVWTTLKRRYPLLGASVEKRSPEDIVFIVRADRLNSLGDGEVSIQKIGSADEIDHFIDRLHNGGERPLSKALLSCARIFQRTDKLDRFHVLFQSSHFISDGVAHNTVLREFLHLLADPTASGSTASAVDLAERLTVSCATETLYTHTDNPARARWRRAIAHVVQGRRRSRLTGGHTLPRTMTDKTKYQPAHSRAISSSFSPEDTDKIIHACRRNGLTFGTVLPIVGHISMTRVLCNRYLQGKMSQEEWEFRKVEPMVNAGPINMRPFLDSTWFQGGGATNASLAIGFFFYQLPLMPLGAMTKASPGDTLPAHLDTLSKALFLHRCKQMKENIAQYCKHPLFCEMNTAYLPARVQYIQDIVTTWLDPTASNGADGQPETPLSVKEQASKGGFILNHGGATLGNLDAVFPWRYPLTRKDTESLDAEVALELLGVSSFLHCRPAELYLGAATFRKQLKYYIFWDGNVYDESIVKEWMRELVDTTLAYLS